MARQLPHDGMQISNYPMTVCGAKTRAGTPCKQKAGWATDHVGQGRCKLHGGKSIGQPIKVGRYSLKHKQSLYNKQADFMADPEPADLTAELALMRALMQDYIERYDDQTNMPAQEIDRIFGMIREISQLVERISKIFSNTSLTQADLLKLQSNLSIWVTEIIDDPERRIYAMGRLAEIMGQPNGASVPDGYTIEAN